jgi:hypothetical protein
MEAFGRRQCRSRNSAGPDGVYDKVAPDVGIQGDEDRGTGQAFFSNDSRQMFINISELGLYLRWFGIGPPKVMFGYRFGVFQ